jgi:hypothetical protein
VGGDGDGGAAAGEQPTATTSMKIVASSHRRTVTFIRASLPPPTGAQYSGEEQRTETCDHHLEGVLADYCRLL